MLKGGLRHGSFFEKTKLGCRDRGVYDTGGEWEVGGARYGSLQ